MTIWRASLEGGAPVKLAEGDGPALSAKGVLAYVKDDQVWTAPLDGKGKPERLVFDRGKGQRAGLVAPTDRSWPSCPIGAVTPSWRSMPTRRIR